MVVLGILICALSLIFAFALVYIEREISYVKDLLEGISQIIPTYEIEDDDEVYEELEPEKTPRDDAELRRKLMN